MAQNYNDTIHKMQTPFEMRAGLPKKEPKMLEDWEQNHVYEQMIKNNEGKPQYILHDGPPSVSYTHLTLPTTERV